jgi:hypothetical protein
LNPKPNYLDYQGFCGLSIWKAFSARQAAPDTRVTLADAER